MKSAPIKKIATNLLKALVALGLLGLVVTRTGFTLEAFVNTLKNSSFPWLAASLPGVLIILYIKAYRWHLLLRQKAIHFSPQKSYIAYLTSFFIGLLTPGRFGEIVKVYYVRALPEAGLFKSFQTVIADRFYDLYFLLSAGLISYLLIFREQQPHWIQAAIWAFPAALILLWMLLKAWRPSNPAQGFFGFLHGSLHLLTGASSLFPWLSTLLAYLAYFLQSWFIARSLHLNIDFLSLSAIMVLTSVVLLLPVTWAGMGTREFSLVMLMALYGISSEQALAFSLLQFTSSFLIGGLTGLAFWFHMPIPRAELRKDYEAIQKLLRFNKNVKS
ncbi:MAG: lysylphosphatidylglycerol synthase transmembrane domain-containing protein [Bacteroidales bacterium]